MRIGIIGAGGIAQAVAKQAGMFLESKSLDKSQPGKLEYFVFVHNGIVAFVGLLMMTFRQLSLAGVVIVGPGRLRASRVITQRKDSAGVKRALTADDPLGRSRTDAVDPSASRVETTLAPPLNVHPAPSKLCGRRDRAARRLLCCCWRSPGLICR